MAETTAISWTDYTGSPWTDCARISPACDGCYAAQLMDTRMHRAEWGAPGSGKGTRSLMSEDYWPSLEGTRISVWVNAWTAPAAFFLTVAHPNAKRTFLRLSVIPFKTSLQALVSVVIERPRDSSDPASVIRIAFLETRRPHTAARAVAAWMLALALVHGVLHRGRVVATRTKVSYISGWKYERGSTDNISARVGIKTRKYYYNCHNYSSSHHSLLIDFVRSRYDSGGRGSYFNFRGIRAIHGLKDRPSTSYGTTRENGLKACDPSAGSSWISGSTLPNTTKIDVHKEQILPPQTREEGDR